MTASAKIRIYKIIGIGILAILLLLVRGLENYLFYDPFKIYFESEYLSGPLPEYNTARLFSALAFRYFLNTLLSLGIIYIIFQDKKLLLFTAAIYTMLFFILSSSFFLMLAYSGSENNFAIFYIRRFLIQPVFLLLFVPAFYYQSRMIKK